VLRGGGGSLPWWLASLHCCCCSWELQPCCPHCSASVCTQEDLGASLGGSGPATGAEGSRRRRCPQAEGKAGARPPLQEQLQPQQPQQPQPPPPALDPAAQLSLRMATPLKGGRRLLFVSQDAADAMRQAMVLERWAGLPCCSLDSSNYELPPLPQTPVAPPAPLTPPLPQQAPAVLRLRLDPDRPPKISHISAHHRTTAPTPALHL